MTDTSYRPATTCARLLAFDRLVDHARACQECTRAQAGDCRTVPCEHYLDLAEAHNTAACDCCPSR